MRSSNGKSLRWYVIAFVCLCACVCTELKAQQVPSIIPVGHIDQPVRLIAKDDFLRIGSFAGLRGDSVVVWFPHKTEVFSYRDILRIEVNIRARQTLGPAIGGLIMGVYAANLAFLRADNQPFSFAQSRDASWFLLVDGFLGLAGAGLGYLKASGGEQIVYSSSGRDEVDTENWRQFLNEIVDSDPKLWIHITAHGAWVNGLPESNQRPSGFGNSGVVVTNLNLVRKIQLVATISNSLDVGLAAMWLGQPSTSVQSDSASKHTERSLELNAKGYYALGIYKPFGNHTQRAWQWDIGCGIGLANIKSKSSSSTYVSNRFPGLVEQTESEINTSRLSLMIYTEFKVFVTEHFSFGLVADYAHIPMDMPVAPFLYKGRTKMGTGSIGFAIGFHF